MVSAEDIVEAAGRQLRQGEPLSAYNTLQEGLAQWPAHARLRQLQALALARSGDVGRANAILDALEREGHDDAETLGMLARTHKDLALRVADAAQRTAHLQSAFDLYQRAYGAARARGDSKAAGYTGINAAATAVFRGDLARARALASEVRTLRAAPADYWAEATQGEAALILGDLEAARTHYASAAALASRRFGDLGTTRRQARLLEGHLPRADEPVSAVLAIPPVVAFSGHMIDAPGRLFPRFASASEAGVRAAIDARMAALAPAAVYGSAACGADILFLEAARKLGCETHVVLPYPAEAFRRESVDFAAADWGARFDRALAAADSVTVTSDHAARGSTATYEYANLVLTGMALLRGRLLDTPVRTMAVHATGAVAQAGGTASVLAVWARAGLAIDRIELPTPPAEPPVESQSSDAAPGGIRHEIRAMLFADAVGYSKFTEDQIPLYITEFLGAVAALNGRSANRYEHVETSGDGLYMVFADALAAGRYALELSGLVNGIDWSARGLPPGFNLRVALHCGPVHCGRDPLTGSPIYTGPHTSRTARIEPITPPGQVYASSAFAAVAAASGGGFALDYVGRMPLAKGYGPLGLYHVRGAA